MAATPIVTAGDDHKKPTRPRRRAKRSREFVVRLESPGLYDSLYNESVKRSRSEQRRVAMTEIVREALEAYLNGK